ncbi:hypothetical protein OIU74_017254 [Salix koriyanagi]|uniref:DM2 domain-containing protein n=1 Tax=Salix koriyanagi TaxID=2511006 RepID=A0A9Q0PI82_9ROSI|nr:hypothetical protein OIU74_017254 [Salix koriyanagi]
MAYAMDNSVDILVKSSFHFLINREGISGAVNTMSLHYSFCLYRLLKMLPQKMKKAITDNPKQLANLIDLVNLPSTLRDFVGQSQISHLGCFVRVWSYIKTNNLQDPKHKNVVNCDEKLKSILLGKQQISLNKLHIQFDGVGTLSNNGIRH